MQHAVVGAIGTASMGAFIFSKNGRFESRLRAMGTFSLIPSALSFVIVLADTPT